MSQTSPAQSPKLAQQPQTSKITDKNSLPAISSAGNPQSPVSLNPKLPSQNRIPSDPNNTTNHINQPSLNGSHSHHQSLQEEDTYITQPNYIVAEKPIGNAEVRFVMPPSENNQMLQVEDVGINVLIKNLDSLVKVNTFFPSVNFIQVRYNILNALTFLNGKFVNRQRVFNQKTSQTNSMLGQQKLNRHLSNQQQHNQVQHQSSQQNSSYNNNQGGQQSQQYQYSDPKNQIERIPAIKLWKEALEQPANDLIFNDGFWLIVLLKNESKIPHDIFSEVYEKLLNRIAINYMEFKADFQGEEKDLFFQIYFDIVSQAVFYAFFFAFPKSRKEFTDDYKIFVFNEFSYLFTGLKISHRSVFVKGWRFIEDWCLELGTGNVFKIYQDNDKNKLPSLRGGNSDGPDAQRSNKFNLNGFRTKIEEQEFKIKNKQQALQRLKDKGQSYGTRTGSYNNQAGLNFTGSYGAGSTGQFSKLSSSQRKQQQSSQGRKMSQQQSSQRKSSKGYSQGYKAQQGAQGNAKKVVSNVTNQDAPKKSLVGKNNVKSLKYSPIAERYLNLRKYKTKNYLKSNNMKLTPYDESQNDYEYKKEVFDGWVNSAKKLCKDHDQKYYQDKDDPTGKGLNKKRRIDEELWRKVNAIKQETLNHIRRLEKRRIEELEKGCHEYANYLVSMLNAGTKNYIVDQ